MLRRVALSLRSKELGEDALREAFDTRPRKVSKATALTLMEAMGEMGFRPAQKQVQLLCDALPGGPRAAQSLFFMVRLDAGTTANAYRLLKDSSLRVWENRHILHEIALSVKHKEPDWWPKRKSDFVPLFMDSCASLELPPIVLSPNQRTIVDDLDSINVKSRALAHMDAVVVPSLKVAFIVKDREDPRPMTTAWRVEILQSNWHVEMLQTGFSGEDRDERRKTLLQRTMTAQKQRLPARRRASIY